MASEPELILHGGIIATMSGGMPDAAGERAEAVAIAGGLVVAAGPVADVVALAGPGTRTVDLRGRAIIPGFQDVHGHPLHEGIEAGWLDLRGTPDRQAALRKVRRVAAEGWDPMNPDRWIEASYHPAAWPDARHPTRDELDRAAPDAPVLLHHGSYHAVVGNSLALALAGVTAARADPPGATIERDEHGEPTGLVLGFEPVAPFAAALPPLSPEALRGAIRRVAARLASDGVTSMTDADLGAVGDPVGELAAYAGAAFDGELPFRLCAMPGLARLAAATEDPPAPADIGALVPGDAAGLVRVGACKLFADGAFTTGDAWLREPYADAAERPADLVRGRPAHPPGELEERILRAHRAGWQIGTHAIGDAGIAAVLAAYRAALADTPRADHRHRIEHAMVLADDLLPEMVELGVIATLQPEFIAATGDVYRARAGAGRSRSIYAYRHWLDAGLAIAFGSDRPVTRGRPLDGIRAAMRHAGPSGVRLADDQSPTVAEALRAWTSAAAWAARDEARTGRIAPGLAADLVVLSADPTAVPPARWAAGDDGVEVVATLLGGIPVFGAEALG